MVLQRRRGTIRLVVNSGTARGASRRRPLADCGDAVTPEDACSPRSTPSSGRPPRRSAARSCVLAGAGTGKTRTITHRAAYAVHDRRRAARGAAGRDLHRARRRGDAHPAAGRSASAASRPAPSTPPRCGSWTTSGRRSSAARRRACSTTSSAWSADAAARAGCDPAPASCATCWPRSSGRPAPSSAPRTTRRRRAAGRARPVRRGRRRPGLRGLPRPQAGAGRGGLRRPAAAAPPACSRSTPTSPRSSARATAPSSSTSTRTSRRCSSGCSTRGSAAATTCASSATPHQTIYSFTGATPVVPARLPPRASRRATEVRLVRDYRSTPAGGRPRQRRHRQGAPARTPARAASASARPARRRSSPSTTTSRPRPPPSPRAAATLVESGTPAERDRRALPGQRAVGGLRGGAHRRRGALPRARRRAVLRPPRGARGAAAAARRRSAPPTPSPRRASPPCRPTSCAPAWRGTPDAPPAGAGRDARAVGVAGGAAPPRRRPGRRRPRAPGCASSSPSWRSAPSAQHAPTVEGVTLASLHAAKGLEWDAVFLVGLVDGTLPLVHADTPDAGRGGAPAALRRRHPRAVEHLTCPGRCRARPAVAARAARRASSTGSLPPSARPAAAAGAARAARRERSGPVACRVCGASLVAAVDRKLGRCADCPVDRDEALFDALRAWRAERAKEPGPAGVLRLHRRDARPPSPSSGRPTSPRSSRSPASGRPSWTSTATRSWPSSAPF